MKNSEILEIKEINELECSITYKVLNKRKKVIYQKNSKKLVDCLNQYLNSLEIKKNDLINQNDLHISKKRIILYIIVYAITLFLVYLIINNSIQRFNSINDISYIISLLLITMSFIVVHLLNYKNNTLLEYEYLKLNNEIMETENIKNNCLKLIK